MSVRTERSLLDWIPFSSRKRAVHLDNSEHTGNTQLKHHCLLVVSVTTSTDCSSSEAKGEFYPEPSGLLRNSCSSNAVIISGHLGALLSYLEETERHIGGRFHVLGDRIETEIVSSRCALTTGSLRRTLFFLNKNDIN